MTSMKICAISDTHGYTFEVPPCDVFCHCGDWSPTDIQDDFVRMQDWLEEFLKHLCRIPCKHVVLIAGNHDMCMESMMLCHAFKDMQYHLGLTTTVIENGYPKHVVKVHYLNRDSIILDGVKFWGSPVTHQVNQYIKRWAFETNSPTYEIPDDADIILTHQPPSGNGLGNTYWKQNRPSKRLGSDELKEAVWNSHAKLLLCGHTHTGNHNLTTLNNVAKTKACNVSMLDEQYEVRYPVAEFYLEV